MTASESPRPGGPGAITLGAKPKAHHTRGFGWCGCTWPPRGHDPGCLWGLDKPSPTVVLAAVQTGPFRPREGCCAICGQGLDQAAVRAHDDRCTRCYRDLATAHRRTVLGGLVTAAPTPPAIPDVLRRHSGNGHHPGADIPPSVDDPSFPSFLLSRPHLACDTGVVDTIVRLIHPVTEADKWAIRASVLALSSAYIGAGPTIRVGFGNLHPPRLYLCMVGDTGQGRKGMGWADVKYLADQALNDGFMDDHIVHGLASGEGTLAALNALDPDKRALCYEPELARLLTVMGREGSTLSPIVRQLWDSGTVHVATRTNPLRVSDAHMAVFAHVTRDELRLRLHASDMMNGLGNRILWIGVQRSAVRAFGGDVDAADMGLVASDWRRALNTARSIARVTFGDQGTRDLWEGWYVRQADLAKQRTGMDAAVHARAEPQALRLALLYALLDGRDHLTAPDLYAAWTVLAHSSRTADLIWPRSATGDPDCDRLLDLLRGADGQQVEKSRITVTYKTAARGVAVATVLVEQGLAVWADQPTGGRTARVLRLTAEGTAKEGRK